RAGAALRYGELLRVGPGIDKDNVTTIEAALVDGSKACPSVSMGQAGSRSCGGLVHEPSLRSSTKWRQKGRHGEECDCRAREAPKPSWIHKCTFARPIKGSSSICKTHFAKFSDSFVSQWMEASKRVLGVEATQYVLRKVSC